ncbi:NAD(P)H-hydrate dehydratase [Jatrophihabitans sp. YIM 134969]
MQAVHTAGDVRAAEARLFEQVPERDVMLRAATGLAVQCAAMLRRVYGARVVLLVGSGNNGGDALFAGAWLARRGAEVRAVLAAPDKAHADGLHALRRAGGRVAGPEVVATADLVVDGLLGIRGAGGIRPPADAWAAAVREAGVPVVAVDIPSGVDSDTGLLHEASIRADVTVVFGALKPGVVSGGGAAAAGEVRLVDIGLGPYLPDPQLTVPAAADVAAWLPSPGASGDKYTRGVVGVVAGSAQYAGAGALATGSAVHGGAGMVRYLGGAPQGIVERYPEVVVHPDTAPHEVRVQSFVVGPGLGTDDAARNSLTDVLAAEVPVVVDADAITLIGQHDDLRAALRARTHPTVLTPHDREFTRLFDLDDDRVASTRAAAAAIGATVLLKGNATVVADPDGTAWVNPTGTPWLGTAGSGDVLSGLIGSLLAAGLAPGHAAAAGAFVHGVAGQLAAADGPPAAEDVLARLRAAWRSVATLA